MNAAEMKEKMGFDPKAVSEDVLKYAKITFDTTFENIAKIQDLNDKMYRNILESGKKVQEDALKMVDEYNENAKKGWNDYKKAIEESLKKVEEMVRTNQ